jgi:hypothetical protein
MIGLINQLVLPPQPDDNISSTQAQVAHSSDSMSSDLLCCMELGLLVSATIHMKEAVIDF